MSSRFESDFKLKCEKISAHASGCSVRAHVVNIRILGRRKLEADSWAGWELNFKAVVCESECIRTVVLWLCSRSSKASSPEIHASADFWGL